ncbi:MAG: hypothetical protein ACPLYX_10150, partial [Rectinema subterraneum]|uniref:hypothetical protein n=1 Tax=Rectinema subterraneum TaxID=2653714 RepID=UPI003C7DFD07
MTENQFKEIAVSWQNEFSASITIIASDFTILYMNDKSAAINAKWGGKALIGK